MVCYLVRKLLLAQHNLTGEELLIFSSVRLLPNTYVKYQNWRPRLICSKNVFIPETLIPCIPTIIWQESHQRRRPKKPPLSKECEVKGTYLNPEMKCLKSQVSTINSQFVSRPISPNKKRGHACMFENDDVNRYKGENPTEETVSLVVEINVAWDIFFSTTQLEFARCAPPSNRAGNRNTGT